MRKALILLGFIIYLFFSFPSSLNAAGYGQCKYGSSKYGEGCMPPAGPPQCTQEAPKSAPYLYSAVPRNGNSIELFFTQAQDPVDHYVLEYGTKKDSYSYGIAKFGDKNSRSILVQSLSPNTTYYFHIRAGNGCATGVWSNTISAKTKYLVSTNDLNITDVDFEKGNVEETSSQKYELRIKTTNTQSEAIEGVLVRLMPGEISKTTDENGYVLFEGLSSGNYQVIYSYNGYEGEQYLNLEGEDKTLEIVIKIRKQNIVLSPLVFVLAGAGLLVIILAAPRIYSRFRI